MLLCGVRDASEEGFSLALEFDGGGERGDQIGAGRVVDATGVERGARIIETTLERRGEFSEALRWMGRVRWRRRIGHRLSVPCAIDASPATDMTTR